MTSYSTFWDDLEIARKEIDPEVEIARLHAVYQRRELELTKELLAAREANETTKIWEVVQMPFEGTSGQAEFTSDTEGNAIVTVDGATVAMSGLKLIPDGVTYKVAIGSSFVPEPNPEHGRE